jgi:hypothetical protein
MAHFRYITVNTMHTINDGGGGGGGGGGGDDDDDDDDKERAVSVTQSYH